MKKILTILLILCSLNSVSQSRLGFTYDEIYNEFPDKVTNFEFRQNILLKFEFFELYHVFDKNGYCYLSTVFVSDVKSAQYFINKYNTEMVTISKGNWAFVEEGFNIYCEQTYSEEIDRVMFIWKYDQ